MAGVGEAVPFQADTADLSGLTVIEASAGTGKTHAIQKLVARLMLQGVPMPRMLVMSYTNAAADELSQRIREELQDALCKLPEADRHARLRLQQAMADLDRACISTIHAFCHRMLQEHPREAGVHGTQGWTLQTDETEPRRHACADAWAAQVAADPELARRVHNFSEVTGGLRCALDHRRDRERVLAADFQASRERARAHLRALGDPACTAVLQALREELIGDVRTAADELLQVAAQGGDPDGQVLSACTKLLNPGKMLKGLSRKAAQAARGQALLASQDWLDCRRAIERLHGSTEGLAQAALDTVVRDALRRLLAHRATTRTLVFDDLITRLAAAVADPSGSMVQALRARFDTVIVDEVQDTDPVQAGILRRTFAESPAHRLILVGDPKQSIYAFRNADVDAYMALRGLSVKPRYRLDVSWRSDPALIAGVQSLFAVEQPFLRQDMPAMEVRSAHPGPRIHGPAGGPPGLALHVAPTTVANDMLDMTARAIAADLQVGWMVDDRREDGTPFRRALAPGDVAVLCHLHWQGRRVADALQALGVPVTVMDRQRVWQSEAAGAVLRLLAAMARPSDRAVALAALAGPCTGLDARAALERPDDWVQALRTAAEQVDRQGVGAALRRLVTVGVPACGRATMLTWARGERLATDFDHVVEELERAQGCGAGTVRALANWLAHRVHDQAEGEDALCRSMGGVDAVQVMTLHGSKGLTFGVTWLPSFMLPPRDGADAVEARRLLYVGLTRARFVSRVVWMAEPRAATSPLAHLLHARGADALETAVQVSTDRLAAPVDGRSDLIGFAAGSGGSVQVLPLDPGPVAAYQPAASMTLSPPRPMPKIPDRAVTLSFTSLSSVKKRFEVEREERDVDAGPPIPHDGPREPVTAMDSALRQAGPSGAALGTLVHDALAEPEAFASLAAGSSAEPLRAALERHAEGLKVRSEGALATLAKALQHALAAPTGDPEVPTVTEMARRPDRCLRELEVAMPWQGSPVELAEVLRDEGAPWSDRVAGVLALGDARERLGSLVGNIDLAVERDGRWFIYDYKTNFLGEHPSAYAPEALHQAMAVELYPLQAALYSVMLTRWLASRGWSAEGGPWVGGVAYLFLRGMDPRHGPQGTWTWRPSARLIQALDDLLPCAAPEASS